MPLMPAHAQAIRIAQMAVKADESGEYAAAVTFYSKAVELIRRAKATLPESQPGDAERLEAYAARYALRLRLLLEHVNDGREPPSLEASLVGELTQ